MARIPRGMKQQGATTRRGIERWAREDEKDMWVNPSKTMRIVVEKGSDSLVGIGDNRRYLFPYAVWLSSKQGNFVLRGKLATHEDAVKYAERWMKKNPPIERTSWRDVD